ncbi:hypothetical protein CPB86DRAFT_819170 [Serendipita vermifera]|nr:hypothetical protein CPB86DRAFT_819170 [Serendipita vermifera]
MVDDNKGLAFALPPHVEKLPTSESGTNTDELDTHSIASQLTVPLTSSASPKCDQQELRLLTWTQIACECLKECEPSVQSNSTIYLLRCAYGIYISGSWFIYRHTRRRLIRPLSKLPTKTPQPSRTQTNINLDQKFSPLTLSAREDVNLPHPAVASRKTPTSPIFSGVTNPVVAKLEGEDTDKLACGVDICYDVLLVANNKPVGKG